MNITQVKHWLSGAFLLATLISAPGLDAATPPHWKDSGFSISADGMTVQEVLEQFGRAYNVRINFDLKNGGIARGRIKADNGAEFLDRMSQDYKFRWFVYTDTLYIVPRDENVSMRIEVGEDAVQDAKAALVGIGLFDSRFGWGELPDEGTVIVTGPRAYVNLARDILLPEEKKASPKAKQVMLFRLKYASATDRTIVVRGQAQIIPGVKTILNNLFFGPGTQQIADSRRAVEIGSGKRSRTGHLGRGNAREVGGDGKTSSLFVRGEEDEEAHAPPRHRGAPGRDEPPRIEAEPALNAVMIYDYGSKRETYRALIAELDIEPQQVEIEALIVDIDRSKLAEMGVEWGVRSGDIVSRINGTRTDSRGVELPLPGSTLLISNAAKFYARLKAMESNGQARVLAKPTVLTLDNVAAVLDLSQTSYVPLVGERIASLADVTAGTMLRVVPRIVREGDFTRVRLEIDIEDGSLGDPNLKTSVTRSTISTQAIIDAQQTLMIGGYHAESLSKNKDKVPVLGDVPLFGNLFKTETDNYSNRERLFLITPRLASTSGVVAPERSRAHRSANRFLETEYQAESTFVPEGLSAVPAITPAPAAVPAPATAPTTVPATVPGPMPAPSSSTWPAPAPSMDRRLGNVLPLPPDVPEGVPAQRPAPALPGASTPRTAPAVPATVPAFSAPVAPLKMATMIQVSYTPPARKLKCAPSGGPVWNSI